ncbi:hypothetical protein JAAARDRAFT_30182 [Jaapia argillacea MUCL 33604]|uniref:Uncharacterized protein n=1 Tax=Jaapia argillacea MUCL 33604 TaxID=933084 RepID=A0A067QFJ4_9AGAM|nr:hypothetical protein JAAARDRAFT_30182 [Jaapia argillacea MUCL 33604]
MDRASSASNSRPSSSATNPQTASALDPSISLDGHPPIQPESTFEEITGSLRWEAYMQSWRTIFSTSHCCPEGLKPPKRRILFTLLTGTPSEEWNSLSKEAKEEWKRAEGEASNIFQRIFYPLASGPVPATTLQGETAHPSTLGASIKWMGPSSRRSGGGRRRDSQVTFQEVATPTTYSGKHQLVSRAGGISDPGLKFVNVSQDYGAQSTISPSSSRSVSTPLDYRSPSDNHASTSRLSESPAPLRLPSDYSSPQPTSPAPPLLYSPVHAIVSLEHRTEASSPTQDASLSETGSNVGPPLPGTLESLYTFLRIPTIEEDGTVTSPTNPSQT